MNPTLFSKITLTQEATIQEAAIHLAKNDLRLGGEVVLYIINEQNKLIGSVMDIDIRKALIHSNISPQEKVTSIMHPSPKKIVPVSYTHLTLPTNVSMCRSRWSPYH